LFQTRCVPGLMCDAYPFADWRNCRQTASVFRPLPFPSRRCCFDAELISVGPIQSLPSPVVFSYSLYLSSLSKRLPTNRPLNHPSPYLINQCAEFPCAEWASNLPLVTLQDSSYDEVRDTPFQRYLPLHRQECALALRRALSGQVHTRTGALSPLCDSPGLACCAEPPNSQLASGRVPPQRLLSKCSFS